MEKQNQEYEKAIEEVRETLTRLVERWEEYSPQAICRTLAELLEEVLPIQSPK